MKILIVLVFIFTQKICAQAPLITNISNRATINLNGKWQYIVDPYEAGFYDYQHGEKNEKASDAYWNSDSKLFGLKATVSISNERLLLPPASSTRLFHFLPEHAALHMAV